MLLFSFAFTVMTIQANILLPIFALVKLLVADFVTYLCFILHMFNQSTEVLENVKI
jgi:hypothetical protein